MRKFGHRKPTERTPYEDELSEWSGSFTRQGMAKITSILPEAEGDVEQILTQSSQKEPILLTYWSQTTSSQNCEKIDFCYWSHPVYYGSPGISGTLVFRRYISHLIHLYIFLFLLPGNHYKSFLPSFNYLSMFIYYFHLKYV